MCILRKWFDLSFKSSLIDIIANCAGESRSLTQNSMWKWESLWCVVGWLFTRFQTLEISLNPLPITFFLRWISKLGTPYHVHTNSLIYSEIYHCIIGYFRNHYRNHISGGFGYLCIIETAFFWILHSKFGMTGWKIEYTIFPIKIVLFPKYLTLYILEFCNALYFGHCFSGGIWYQKVLQLNTGRRK